MQYAIFQHGQNPHSKTKKETVIIFDIIYLTSP